MVHLSTSASLLLAASVALLLPEAQSSVSPDLQATITTHHDDSQTPSIIPSTKRLTEDTMSPNIRKMEYAVRGKIVIAADKIADELKEIQSGSANAMQRSVKYDFDHIVYTNIGNPQSMGQAPLTWPRQVMALVDLPASIGVDHPLAPQLFPADAIARAREIQAALACGSTGAYSHSKGVKLFRDDVAQFISQRDGGIETDAEDIFLTNGASAGIVMILNALIADSTWYVLLLYYFGCWGLRYYYFLLAVANTSNTYFPHTG